MAVSPELLLPRLKTRIPTLMLKTCRARNESTAHKATGRKPALAQRVSGPVDATREKVMRPLFDYGQGRGWPIGLWATTLKFESTPGKMNAGLIILRVASLGLWATTLKLKSTPGKMNAGLIILRVASRCDAQNERDGAGLRSSVAAATPSQLHRSSIAAAL